MVPTSCVKEGEYMPVEYNGSILPEPCIGLYLKKYYV